MSLLFKQLNNKTNEMIRELPRELAKIAEEELNEKPSQTKHDVEHLKEWISKQKHLKARTDDQWLVAMLRGCKFSLEKVKQKLELYYTLRTTAPEITMSIKPTDPKFLEFFRQGTCIVLDKPKSELYPRVIVIRPGRYDPAVHSIADVICIFYYLVQILMVEDDVASVMGTKILVDYEGVTMNHLVQANPVLLKKTVTVTQDSMPLRLKGSHHINLPSGIETIFNLVSGFLNEKAKERLKIHKNFEELSQVMPKDMIPKDYGGDGESVAKLIDMWCSKFQDYRTWMKQEETFGVDESKRMGQPVNQAMMGIDGSFRKLDID